MTATSSVEAGLNPFTRLESAMATRALFLEQVYNNEYSVAVATNNVKATRNRHCAAGMHCQRTQASAECTMNGQWTKKMDGKYRLCPKPDLSQLHWGMNDLTDQWTSRVKEALTKS
jgi:hypothetical protein